MILLQAKGLPPVAAPAPVPAPTSKGTPRLIAEDDLLDKIGLGAWADVFVMSTLSAFLGALLVGILLFVFRRAFGSTEDQAKAYNDTERMFFDLVKRKAKAQNRIIGLQGQAKAVIASLDKVR